MSRSLADESRKKLRAINALPTGPAVGITLVAGVVNHSFTAPAELARNRNDFR